AATRSGLDGTFQLPAPADVGTIIATAPGFASAKAPPSASPLSFVLQPEARLLVKTAAASAITVVDAAGIPRIRRSKSAGALFERLAPGPCSVMRGPGRGRRVDLAAGVTSEVAFDAGARVSGRVTAAGRTCAQAVVALATAGPEGTGVSSGVRAD